MAKTSKSKTKTTGRYRVRDRGLEWETDGGDSRRAEPGALLPADFPESDIAEHLKSGLIEPATATKSAIRNRKSAKKGVR